MKKTILSLATILCALAASAQITTRIEGRIIGDSPKKGTLLFVEFNQDLRIKSADEILVKDGRFYYEWTAKDTTAFNLIFEDEYVAGSWKEYTVFSEGGTLHIAIAHGDPDMEVSGNGLTKQFYSLRKKLYEIYRAEERLKKEDNYFTADTKKALTPEARRMEIEEAKLYESMTAAQDSIVEVETSPLGLLFLTKNILKLSRSELSPQKLQTFARYEAAYPEHPLTIVCQTAIISSQINQYGGQIPELKARDLDGNEVSLRSLITTKFTILDLWASWCGPCRRHSKELIPIYEEYKDRGFSVLAVAREYKDTGAMKAAMKKDGYPWPSYVDLGDEFQVWQQMGAGNAGGAIFLLDSEGKVLKTNPTTEEVRDFLNENLK